jgi:hypothetical protein
MKRILMVVASYGLVVASAQAGERWSAESCKHLQEMKADTYAAQYGPEITQWQLVPILLFQKRHCGVDTQAELIAAQDAAKRVRLERRGTSAPRQPLHCLTIPMSGGDSMTNCN